MGIPFICNKCDAEKEFDDIFPLRQPCGCGAEMEIYYQDNFEQDHDVTTCNTCIHNRVGEGEKCNYCSNI